MSETVRDTIADDSLTYKAIDKESIQGGPIDKKNNPELYKFVEKQAKDLGLDIEKDGLKTYIVIGDKSYTASIDYKTKTLYLDKNLLNKTSEDPQQDSNNLAALERLIKHEFQHYKDSKMGYYDSKWFDSESDVMKTKKIGECRADFVSIGNRGTQESQSSLSLLEGEHESNTHPSDIDRFKSLIIQSYIKEKTKSESNPNGIELTLGDIKFNDKCEFSIANKDKLHAIPYKVLQEAYEKAEDQARYVADMGKEMKEIGGTMKDMKDGRFSSPSVPLNPQPQQDKSTPAAGH